MLDLGYLLGDISGGRRSKGGFRKEVIPALVRETGGKKAARLK